MHIAKNANETQLWTVIPYAVATPITGKFNLLFYESPAVLTMASSGCLHF